jgi:hypothetical protein
VAQGLGPDFKLQNCKKTKTPPSPLEEMDAEFVYYKVSPQFFTAQRAGEKERRTAARNSSATHWPKKPRATAIGENPSFPLFFSPEL